MKLTKEEELIYKALIEARSIQDYLWGKLNSVFLTMDVAHFTKLFQKRVDKISSLNVEHPHAKVELKKRLLQQAALSILALRVLDEHEKLES